MSTNLRWIVPCVHECACGVNMNGTDADLDAWFTQHMAFSKIHKDYMLKKEMDQLVEEKEIRDLIAGENNDGHQL